MSEEQQYEDQYLDMKGQFECWLYGEEIRGDFFKACEILRDKIPQVIDQNTLFDAYFWQPRKSVGGIDPDEELPF